MPVDFSQYVNFEQHFLPHLKDATRKGDELTGLCPFHEDKNASFGVNVQTGVWKCFGCGKSGNLVTFESTRQGISTKDAFKQLCQTYSVPPPPGMKKPSKESPKSLPAPEELPPMPEKIREWVVKKRGWSVEVIQERHIGWLAQEERFTIPVFDEEGRLANIRRYRPGLDKDKFLNWKGCGTARLYPLDAIKNARDRQEPVLICEGEPDTLCGLSHGLNCVTQTAGAGTWKHEWNALFKHLHVIVVYDNDEAGQEGMKKVTKYVPMFAAKMEVLEWPSWLAKGEDLTDWFVKHGKTADELLALPRREVLPPEEKGVKQEKIAVEEAEGCYWHTTFSPQHGKFQTKISNFTMKIIRNYSYPEPLGIVRTLRLTHENGYVKEADVEASCMAWQKQFSSWLLSKGNFVWSGAPKDLNELWRMLLQTDDGKMIYRHDHVGYVRKHDLWVFGDNAVKDGKVLKPDEDGVIWVGERGYQALNLSTDDQERATSALIPTLRDDLSDTAARELRHKMVTLLKTNLGFEAYLALGFVASSVYSEEIFPRYKSPILYIYGRRQCGKSTLASWIVGHFGLDESTAENVAKVTLVALYRRLAYYSCIPLWIDEYRNDQDCQRKDSVIRSAYDRVGGSRGKVGFGLSVPIVRAPLIVTGEAWPEDSATASRCAMVHLNIHKRDDSVFREIQGLQPRLSAIVMQMIREKTPEKARELLQGIEATTDYLSKSEKLDPRLASIYAVLGESFNLLYNPEDVLQDRKEFGDWLLEEAHQQKRDKEEGFLVNEFFSDLESLRARGQLNGTHVGVYGNEVRIWLKGTWDVYAEHIARRKGTLWTFADIFKYIKDEPYFVGQDRRYIGRARRRCVILDFHKLPEHLAEIFEEDWEKSET